MTFRDFVVGVLADELDGFSGLHYTSELAFDLLEVYNRTGSYTCCTHRSREMIADYWEDAADYYDYEKDNFGDAQNPFDNPEGYLVCMMIWKAEEILAELHIVQENDQLDFDDEDVVRQFKYELTGEFIMDDILFPDMVQCRAG